jgi:hypothetical protein
MVQSNAKQVSCNILQCIYFIFMCFVSQIFPSGEEEEDDACHNAKDTTAAADDNDDDEDDNNKDKDGTIMPPKVKPAAATAATKTAAKKPKKDNEITHLPAPKLPKILNCSIEAEDPSPSRTTPTVCTTTPGWCSVLTG